MTTTATTLPMPLLARPASPPGAVSATLAVARRTVLKFVRTPQLIVVGTVQGAMFLLIFRYVFGGAISTGPIPYVDFLVPGYVVSGVLFSGTTAATGIAEDIEQGFFDRLRSLPIPRTSVLAGRAVADTALGTWGLLVTAAIGYAVGFRLHGGLAAGLAALGLCVVYGFAFIWLFVALGLYARSAQAAQGLSLLVFPLTFVSSAYVPVDTMPGWMQPVAAHQPLTYMVDSVRVLVLGDEGEALLGHSAGWFTARALAWCAVLLAVFVPLAVARYRRG